MNRRKFLNRLLRGVFAAALAAVAARLLPRRTASRKGEICLRLGLCRGCSRFASCGLPTALSAREAAEGFRGKERSDGP